VSSQPLPETVAHIRVTHLSWQEGLLKGEIQTDVYQWQFQWHFRRRRLLVQPSLGRSLIYEPLGRFLERSDYQLEPGSDYELVLRAKL
jgi:hypothetical protein